MLCSLPHPCQIPGGNDVGEVSNANDITSSPPVDQGGDVGDLGASKMVSVRATATTTAIDTATALDTATTTAVDAATANDAAITTAVDAATAKDASNVLDSATATSTALGPDVAVNISGTELLRLRGGAGRKRAREADKQSNKVDQQQQEQASGWAGDKAEGGPGAPAQGGGGRLGVTDDQAPVPQEGGEDGDNEAAAVGERLEVGSVSVGMRVEVTTDEEGLRSAW